MTFSRRKFRTRLAWTLPAVIGGVLAQGPACAQSNPVTTAPAQLRIERIAQSDWPAKVGVADIAPCISSPSRFGVFDADGKPVAFQILWSAPGEATRICFDTSGGGAGYYVCFDNEPPRAPGGWKPEAGVVVETRACRGDLPMDNAQQFAQMLNTAGPPLGRDYVPNIFLGANPFGPTAYYVATFSGWFAVPSAAQYTFATASVDASSLEVDNRPVAAWYGMHGAGGGAHGEHSGTIMLSPGLHHLSYVQIQLTGAAAAVAAWKPPGRDRLEVIPASAFGSFARFRASRFESAPPGAGRLYFDWTALEQCALGEAMFVRMQFRVVDAGQRRTYRWRFDDGTEETGANLRHFFPLPGLRQVSVEALQNGVVVATNSLRVRVAPEWQQGEYWREGVFNQAKNDFLRRDPAVMPARDLMAVLDFAQLADDPDLIMRMGEGLIRRQTEFNAAAYAATFYRVGLAFEHQGDSGDGLAEKSFRLALAPQRLVPAISDPAKLHLAALLIHCTGELDEAGKLLGGVSANLSDADERRLLRLLQGDLLLAHGKKEEAHKQYAAVGDKPAGGVPGVARAARLEGASILLDHGRWDDAQAALDRLQLEMPLERMSLDTGLLALNLEMERKEFQRALTDGRMLLTVAGDDPRQSEILYTVVEAGLDLGKNDDARRALGQLLKDFPYSEAAAKAKDRFQH